MRMTIEIFASFVAWHGNVPAELNYHFENDAWLMYVNGIFEGDSEEAFLYDGDVIEFRFNEDFVHDICKEAANDADVPFEPATYSNLMCFLSSYLLLLSLSCCCSLFFDSIGEDATAAKTSSSASTSLAIPSGLMAGFTPKVEEKAESEGTDDHEESTDDHGDITMNKILQAIKDSELRIIAEVRKTIQLTKVKTFVFEDDDNHGMTCNQTSSTDI